MPSRRVIGLQVTLDRFDVVGTDGDQVGFIRHAGLAAHEGEHDREAVAVYEMAPPLRAPGKTPVDSCGTAGLTDDEARKIQVFIDLHANEHEAIKGLSRDNLPRCYTVLPHATPFREDDGRFTRMRFSCAGFVIEAFRKARITLVVDEALPSVDLDLIKRAYSDYARFLDVEDFRESMGLSGSGPWPVMFCGYLFQALNQAPAAIRQAPYSPKRGDEIFGG